MGGKGYNTKYKYRLSQKQRIRIGIPDSAIDVRVTKIGGMINISWKEIINGIVVVRNKWEMIAEKEIKRKNKRK